MNKYMDYKNLSPTLLAKTKGLEKCVARCEICCGTGLVKKKVTSYLCDCLSNQFCSICQNKYKYGNYQECNVCYGLGVITIKMDKKVNYNSIAN